MKVNRFIILVFLYLFLLPHVLFAQSMNSTNYKLENSSFNAGGEQSSSTNYISRDSAGDANDSSSSSANYKVSPGTIQPFYPGVPATPTLTNTGGTLYSSLDFVVATGGNATDAQYAIAISNNDFVTTYFIQANDTLSTTVAWQTYTNWGSSGGERVTGLASSTIYKIKVKARFGADSESAYSPTAQATTASPSISVSFTGVANSTSVEGQTTNVTTTSTTMPFATLAVGTAKVAAQTITVSTNATNGYTTTIRQDDNLKQAQNKQMDTVSGTNTSPSTFPGSISHSAFGYHTSDTTLCTGTTDRFTADDTYAGLTTTAAEVACSSAAVSGDATSIVYKLLIGATQENGSYTNKIYYITTGTF